MADAIQESHAEVWKPVVEYEGLYEVSDLGRVRSLPRPRTPGKVLAGARDGQARNRVVLSKNGVHATRLVCHLVLEAHRAPRPQGMDCCHYDGDASNDTLANLRWDTKQANMADAMRHGTFVRGEDSHHARLKERDVRAIRARADAKENQHIIAKDYGVSPSMVSMIHRRKKWAWLV